MMQSFTNLLQNKTLNKIIVLCIQTLIIFALFISLHILESKEILDLNANIDEWSSSYISYNDGWYIDENLCQTNSTVDMIYGPDSFMPKGYHTLKIWYECNNNQSFKPYANNENYSYIKTGTGILDSHLTYVTYQFKTTEDIDNFEVQIKYNGKGYLKINKIEIEDNHNGLKSALFMLFFLFLITDVLWFNKEWLSLHKKIVWTLLGLILLSSLPIMMEGINAGHDLKFHIMRIEGIANELRKGTFPVRMSSNWMAGYGYPVSIYYGDILLYFPAILRIVGFTINEAYKAYLVLINLLTVILSYISFRKIFKRQDIAILTTLAYSLSTYRMMNLYIRSSVGEYSAQAFLPVIAWAIFNIYTEDEVRWKYYARNSLILTLGMTGIIETHILTTEMVVFFLMLICILFAKKTFRLRTLKVYLLAIIETVLLNLWFLVPFIDYYLNVPVSINDSVSGEAAKCIQIGGVYILQYFSFLQSPYGKNSAAVNERMSMTPGFLLMAALVIGIILWINGKADKKIKLIVLLSLIVLFVASNLFPWDHLAANYKLGNFLAQVQFPWRYVGLATILLTILLGMILTVGFNSSNINEPKKTFVFIAVIGIISSFGFTSLYCNGASCIHYYDSAELDIFDSVLGGEYLRIGISKNTFANLNKNVTTENVDTLNILSRSGPDMELYCETNNIEGKLILPIFNYKGYQVKDSNGILYEITDGPNTEITITVPANYSGNITLSFVSPWYWKGAELISLLVAILVSTYYAKKVKQYFLVGL